jgi:hypothetical protein
MPELHAYIPIQYVIETELDWTRFSIIEEGFSWNDIELEFLKGEDKLAQYVMFNEKVIWIKKKDWDTSLVEVKIYCKLNVQENRLDSNIRYRIEKGDAKYTRVRVFFMGKEVNRLENNEKVAGNSNNPKEFSVSIPKYPEQETSSQRTSSQILSGTYTFLKIASLFGFSFLIVSIITYVYCAALSFDFLEIARTNISVFILGSLALFASFMTVASKRNWI